jgi:hypothetical protein
VKSEVAADIAAELSIKAPPTEICITIDTEFSIGGAFSDPLKFRPIAMPNIDCPSEGERHGLPFLLKNFARYGIKGTFFVETLSRAYFGDEPLRTVIATILDAGQDAQLHIHPNWLEIGGNGWCSRGIWERDACAGRSVAEIEELLVLGLKPFTDWKFPRPIALRVGNFEVDRNVYVAMARVGLEVASNIGLAIYRPEESSLQLYSGRHLIDGILEIPVLSYRQLGLGPMKRLHALSITGVGTTETIALLRAARQKGISPVVILTHPFEFIKCGPAGAPTARPNRLNKDRLVALCKFIADHPDEFTTESFGQGAKRWIGNSSRTNHELRAPLISALSTLAANTANDRLRWI